MAAPDDDTEDLTAQSAMSAPDRDLEAQAPQANTVTSEQTDEFQQLQEQLRATQQQLQEAKIQLEAAKERETQLRTAREREQHPLPTTRSAVRTCGNAGRTSGDSGTPCTVSVTCNDEEKRQVASNRAQSNYIEQSDWELQSGKKLGVDVPS